MAFAESINACAVQTPSVSVLFAVESGTDVGPFVPSDVDPLNVHVHQALPGVTGPALRQVMLDEAARCESCDYVMFLDCDDRLRPEAPALYSEALDDADIAYGDMQLIDRDGCDIDATLFGGCIVPERLENYSELSRRNVIGLSNSAIKRNRLADTELSVPDSITAVDWWLFTTLLERGFTARRADGRVADYRQYERNTLGSKSISDLRTVRRLIDIVKQHYDALPQTDDRKQALAPILQLEAVLDHTPDRVEALLHRTDAAGLWYEELFQIAHAVSGQ